jgi:hypothetical protein
MYTFTLLVLRFWRHDQCSSSCSGSSMTVTKDVGRKEGRKEGEASNIDHIEAAATKFFFKVVNLT